MAQLTRPWGSNCEWGFYHNGLAHLELVGGLGYRAMCRVAKSRGSFVAVMAAASEDGSHTTSLPRVPRPVLGS